MSAKTVSVSSLIIRVPSLTDGETLRHQFIGKTCGNDEALDKAYDLLPPETGSEIGFRMVLVEAQSSLGSPASEIISEACNATRVSPHSMAKPLLSQIAALTSLFEDELDVQRAVPVIKDNVMTCLLWKRATWPSYKQPVFRAHNGKNPIHDSVWMMIPSICQ